MKAVSIVEQASEIAPGLEAELKKLVNWGAEELQQEHLSKIGDFAEKLAELWEISFAGLTAQKYLPAELRKCKKTRLIPPMQSAFEIDVTEIGQQYRPLSRTSLPD